MQSKMMMQQQRPDMTDQEKQMYRVMAQTTYLMPVLIAVFALNFNQGIGLYWITQSGVMVIQVFSMMGWGGLKVPPWFPGAGWRPKNSPMRQTPPGSVGVLPAGATSSNLVPGNGRRKPPPRRPPSRRPRPKERGRSGR
jgi:hypothetical protein